MRRGRPPQSSAWAAAALALGAAACGPPPATPSAVPGGTGEPPPSSSPHALPGDAKGKAGTKPEDEKNPAGAAKPSGPRVGVFSHLWTYETADWNGGLLITKDGDVLSFSSKGIRVHARDDGRVLHQANGCSPVSEDAVAFTADDRFVVVCDDELREFSWPKLGGKKLAGFSQRVDRGAVGGGLVAAAEDGFFAKDKKGKVALYDARDGHVVDEFVPPAEVETLALSADGTKLVVGTRDAGVVLRDVKAKKSEAWSDRSGGGGAAFAPDGRSLFGDFATFEASTIDLATGKAARRWKVGSWITASRWIDATTIAATGSDGLSIFSADEKVTAAPVGDLGEGIAVSKDGGTLCAGGRGGRIACFGKSKPGPTTIAGAFAGSPAGGSRDAGDAAGPEIDAKILGRKGKTLEVSIDPARTVELGSTGSVSKPFQTNVGFAISGWIVIAQVKVVKAAAGKLTLEIVETKSAMTVNGRQVDHFAPGPAKLQLSAPP